MRRNIPKVSLVMSVRNGGRYLTYAVDSILNQTFRDFEFIIINDASQDNTQTILEKIKDSRVRILVNKRKKGLTRSLNMGLTKIQGEYIARMDSDDLSRKDRLKVQVNFLENNKNIGVVGSWVKLINAQGKSLGILKFPTNHKEISQKIFLFNPIRHSTVLFRKELIEKYGMYDEYLDGAEDYDLWLRFAKFTNLANINIPLVSYRLHQEMVSAKEERKVLRAAIITRLKAVKVYKYSLVNLIHLLIPTLSYFTPSAIKKNLIKLSLFLQKIVYLILKTTIYLIQKTSVLTSVAIRLVKLTGKYPEPIHPKHLIKRKNPWFLPYIDKNDVILDIGCNNAQNSILLTKRCKKIIGFDRDSQVLEMAKRDILRRRIKNITLIRIDAEKKLPFADNSFDKILFFAILEHLRNRKQIISEISRVLKPNKLLLMSIPNKDTWWKKVQKKFGLFYYSDPDHKVEYKESTIIKFLEKNKFKVINLLPVAFDIPFVGIIDLIGGFSLNLYKLISKLRSKLALNNKNQSVSFEIVAQNLKNK